jgi:hypothetical protein
MLMSIVFMRKQTATKNTGKLASVLHVVCLALVFSSFAQAQSSNQAARKFDEFGDIYLTDIKARADNFAIQLQNQPDARGFIIVYRTRRDLPGLSSRLAGRIKGYMVYSRGIAAERVITVDGGEADCLTQELWIAPAGTAPTPRSYAYSQQFIDTETALKFDEYYYPQPQDADLEDAEYAGSSLEAYAEALRKQPGAQGYIVVYPQYYIERWEDYDAEGKSKGMKRRLHFDQPATALKVLNAVKGELVGKYRIASSRVKVMNGGYRRLREVELWIVPRGVHAPIATPNAFPKKRR